jgi:hypothetical protein
MTVRCPVAAQALSCAWLVLMVASARAQPAADDPVSAEAEACATAFERVQELRNSSKLVEAQKQAIVCSSRHCPDLVVGPCVGWLEELAAEIPSIVVAARDDRGSDLVAARLVVDGKVMATSLDGTPISLDPGRHRVRVEKSDGGGSHEVEIVLRVGERRRTVNVVFKATAVDPPVVDAPGIGWAPAAVSWALGAAGLVVGAVAGGIALAKESDLADACPTPATCDPARRDDIDAMNTSAHVSTAGFVVGGVGIAAAIVLTVLAASEGEPSNRAGFFVADGAIGFRL